MKKAVFLFSGQGSQYAGMGKDLCAQFPAAKAVYETASEIFGYDALEKSGSLSETELAQTGNSQPLIFTLSMAALAVLEEAGAFPAAAAGFSLGEVTALCAAGAMDLPTGCRVVRARAKAMQAAAERSNGAMFAVLGVPEADVKAACDAQASKGIVLPVNYNCPGQVVIAGEEPAAQAAADGLQAAGARVVRLGVNAAFHSPCMEPAALEFYESIRNLPFCAPAVPLYSNVSGGRAAPADVPAYLRTQMVSPVRFIDEMAAMERDGFDTFVELGPGRTLCGFLRRGLRGAASCNAEDAKSVAKALALLAEPA